MQRNSLQCVLSLITVYMSHCKGRSFSHNCMITLYIVRYNSVVFVIVFGLVSCDY